MYTTTLNGGTFDEYFGVFAISNISVPTNNFGNIIFGDGLGSFSNGLIAYITQYRHFGTTYFVVYKKINGVITVLYEQVPIPAVVTDDVFKVRINSTNDLIVLRNGIEIVNINNLGLTFSDAYLYLSNGDSANTGNTVMFDYINIQALPFDPSGYVKDQNGNAISGATVTLFNATISKSAISNSTGYWNLSGQIADGAYSYKVTKIGYSDKTGTASIASGGNSLNITLSPAAITPIDVKIAVILAEPSDDSHNTIHDKNYYLANIIPDIKDYYREVSYGAVNIVINPEDVYDNNGNWYKLGKTASYYGKNITKRRANGTTYEDGTDNSSQFLLDAAEAADNDINFSSYDAVIVIHANKSQQEIGGNWDSMLTHAWMGDYNISSGDIAKNLILDSEYELMGTWAHETGHALGRIFQPFKPPYYLPDLYGVKGVKDWDLMGSGNWLGNPAGSNPDHMSSYSKDWIGWLENKSVGYGTYWINSLATMNYGDEITRYIIKKDPQINLTSYYIIETRTNNPAYSNWDTSAPIPQGYSNALVLYQVEELDKNLTVNYIANLLPREGFWDSSYWDFASKVRFTALEERNRTGVTKPIFEMKVGIQNFSSSWIVGAILEHIDNLMGYIPPNIWSSSLNSEVPLPDLDLHAYAPDGKHVGVNYTTGAYENEIPGANASGDLLNGREWIFVPDNIKVQFVVDSKDNWAFLNSYPEVQQITNGTQSYNLSIVYDVPDDIRYIAFVEQSIQPNEAKNYNYLIARNADGTYGIMINELLLPALVEIEPHTLNINSNGKWIQAKIKIPGYSASQIDISSIRLNETIPAEIVKEFEKDGKKDSKDSELKVKFNRAQVESIVSPGIVTLYISGKVNGVNFLGNDTIRVIENKKIDDKRLSV